MSRRLCAGLSGKKKKKYCISPFDHRRTVTYIIIKKKKKKPNPTTFNHLSFCWGRDTIGRIRMHYFYYYTYYY